MDGAKEHNRRSVEHVTATSPLASDFFDRYFAFFGPGHTEGHVAPRIKDLARLKVAALNHCDN